DYYCASYAGPNTYIF
nr:immunoglobulin light chain junction region [Macaca mulatta]MOW04271.1 immunoglobulin light chain junction region [Macaca mulatta]MOW04515.1 immunoglobulin light chain junction region [Macaca mulatta]MOW04863.1 immunoglobulin light chain junction region [Macaca mulatta]MOW04956.1 immunoglobulin light chain junction region [Macaca mulatta]